MSILNASFRTVGSFIQENSYWIPDYQREYSWEAEDQVDDFWRDLEELIEENREQHFLGQIVVHNSNVESKMFLIDGQQRTSTVVILLSIMHDLFKKLYKDFDHRNSQNRCEDIRLKYIGRSSEDENELKLFLGNIDRDYFAKNIQSGTPKNNDVDKITSHLRIKKAYLYLEKRLTEKMENKNEVKEKYEVLHEYYRSLIEKFKVMYIETNDINEAFIIFETLNARGKELETADLLKNHIFRTSGDKLDIVKLKWNDIIDILDTIDPTKFIRHFWNSMSTFTREKDLYKKMRENISTSKKSEKFISDLKESAELYKSLCRPEEESYYSYKKLNESLIVLKNLKASSFYPIILSMQARNFDEESIYKVVRQIEVLVLRNFVIAGKVANKYETIFAKIALNIFEKEYTEIDEILNRINKEILPDEEFGFMFEKFSSTNKVAVRYILRSINNSLNEEVKTIEDNNKIHIEHIMPQSKGNWNITDEEHQEYIWRIGNLTLLGAEYNKRNSRKLFEDKKNIYMNSKIDITSNLTEYKEWNINTIQERQKKLTEIALKVWSIN